jgi:hypothetical protein
MAIKSCSCKNDFQDKMYGPGRRVYNECKTASAGTKHRCSVCLKETQSGDSKKK